MKRFNIKTLVIGLLILIIMLVIIFTAFGQDQLVTKFLDLQLELPATAAY